MLVERAAGTGRRAVGAERSTAELGLWAARPEMIAGSLPLGQTTIEREYPTDSSN